MNILVDRLPSAVVIDELNYPINTDFRTWVNFELLMLDSGVTTEQKTITLLNLYIKDLPPSLNSAMQALMEFYMGSNIASGESKIQDRCKQPIYSFEYDADYIYSAFMAQYGIDLQIANLHWWQFKALFKSLNDTNQIVKIMEYRSIDLNQVKDKEQKKFYRKMKALYCLPDLRSEEEKERDMINNLSSLF